MAAVNNDACLLNCSDNLKMCWDAECRGSFCSNEKADTLKGLTENDLLWARKLTCGVCQKTWHVCTVCPEHGNSKHISDHQKLRRHSKSRRSYHISVHPESMDQQQQVSQMLHSGATSEDRAMLPVDEGTASFSVEAGESLHDSPEGQQDVSSGARRAFSQVSFPSNANPANFDHFTGREKGRREDPNKVFFRPSMIENLELHQLSAEASLEVWK